MQLKTTLFLLLSFAVFAQSPLVDEQVVQGDSAFVTFKHKTALAHYQKAYQTDSTFYDAIWKTSRAYIDIAESMKTDDERKSYYTKAVLFAQKAITQDSTNAKGYLMLAISLGRKALDSGAKERVKISKDIRKAAEKAIALDATEDGAWHVLGRWHRKMANLGWVERNFANVFLGGIPKDASMEEALKCLKKATKLHNSFINHHFELAKTYEMLGQKELAILEYQTVARLPITDSEDYWHKMNAESSLKALR